MIMKEKHEVDIIFNYDEKEVFKNAFAIINDIYDKMDENHQVLDGDNFVDYWELKTVRQVLFMFSKNDEVCLYQVEGE